MVGTGNHWYDDELVLPVQKCHLHYIASWSLYQCQMSQKYCLSGFVGPTVQLPSLDSHCPYLVAADKVVFNFHIQTLFDKSSGHTLKKST